MLSVSFLFISLSATVAVTSGIKCYTCDTALGLGNKDCNDPFDTAKTEDMVYDTCDGCVKTKITAGDVNSISRQCLSGDTWNGMKKNLGSDDCEDKEQDGNSVEVCACDSDLCNGAAKIGRGDTALMVSILALPLIVATLYAY